MSNDEDRRSRKARRHAFMYSSGKQSLREMQLLYDLLDANEKELCDMLLDEMKNQMKGLTDEQPSNHKTAR